MSKIRKRLALAVIAGAFLSTPAVAATLLFNFTALAGPASSFSFTADSSPSPVLAMSSAFKLEGVDVNLGGTTASKDLTFWDSSFGGGLEGKEGLSTVFNLFGPQLFTGPLDAPTFLTGSFDLNSQSPGGPPAGTLTISSVSGVPEPATWAMMLIGFGAVGISMRRRKQTEVTFRRAA